MEEASAQNSRAAHDRRHFNNVLLELLERGETGEAAALLQSQNQATPIISRVFCKIPPSTPPSAIMPSLPSRRAFRRKSSWIFPTI